MQINNKLLRQFSQYVVVGLAFLIDFSALFVLTQYAGFHYLLSATVGFLLGLITNYLMCVRWIFTFRAVEKITHEFAMFSAIGVTGLLLNNALMYGLTDWGDFHYLVSKLASAAAILVFSFSLRRALLFSERGTRRPLPGNMGAGTLN